MASTPVTAEQPDANAFRIEDDSQRGCRMDGDARPDRRDRVATEGREEHQRQHAHDEHGRGQHQKPGGLADPEHVHGRQEHEPDQGHEQQMVCERRKTLPRLAAPAARLTATVST